MKKNIPHSPFSTRLSGSAKETELRLRSIFQWKKKRPPVIAMLLAALVVLFCFSLFSCRMEEEPPAEESPTADNPVVQTPNQDDNTGPAVNEPSAGELSSLTVEVDQLLAFMEEMETGETYPAETWQLEVTGLSVPVKLTMHLDRVAELDAHGQHVFLTNPLDIYGNRNFDLFEHDGVLILEGGYYWIGDVYVLSPETRSECHPGANASYYLYRNDQGDLKYRRSHNKIADITQIGCLSVATQYGEFLGSVGDASVAGGELTFSEPDEQYFMEYETLWKEFELGWWSEHYASVEEILEINRAKKEGREPSPIYSLSYRNDLICQYYSNGLRRVYMAGEEPTQPQEGDLRIEEITVLAETRVNEVTGQLLEVRQSRCGSDGWQEFSGYLVITREMDNAYGQVIGTPTVHEGQTVDEIILQEIHGLLDLEVSVWRDGYPWPVGPGSQIHIHREAYDGPETVEVHEDWEPIYCEGDYWAVHRWNGVEALCYHSAADGGYGVNTFDTTRTDLSTRRGIRVGDSRGKVMETYPELKSGDYWGKYPGEDYLWFCRSEQDFGAALIFFFENDVVSRIVLTDMFN